MGRKGVSKIPFQDEAEQGLMLRYFAQGKTDVEVAALTGWQVVDVARTRYEFFPTASLASAYLRSKALSLAKRVVEEANVEEAMDVLSRGNIGVLAPAVKGDGNVRAQVLTSVTTDSLGGVQVGTAVAIGAPPHSEAPDVDDPLARWELVVPRD